MNLQLAHQNMIKGQVLPMGVSCPTVIAALAQVPRHLFLPKELTSIAYIDNHIEFGHNRYLLSPSCFARLLQAAEIKNTDKVLDIGCLFGYSSAVLSCLASKVTAVECENSFAAIAHNNLHKYDLDNVITLKNELCQGYAKCGPYDVIIINGSVNQISEDLLSQLSEGGRLVGILQENNVGKAIILTKKNNSYAKNILFEENLPSFF